MSGAEKVYEVLFVCRANSARSIMAECALSRFGGARFRGHSAGLEPRGELHPMTVRTLEALKYDVSALRSKSVEEFLGAGAPRLHFVFAVDEHIPVESLPAFPGNPMTADWPITDPVPFVGSEEKTYAVFKASYIELERRVKIFSSLRLDALDRLLQDNLDSIGALPRT